MKKYSLILATTILIHFSANATHSIGGDITAKCIFGHIYRLTFTYYERISSPADRDTIEMIVSDSTSGFSQSIIVGFSSTVYFAPDVNKRIFDTVFVFPDVGDYEISVEDPNRTDGVVNIPNSVNVPFFNVCKIHVDLFNSSPVFLNDPIIYVQQGVPFTYNPLPYDENDDSLSWSLVVPLGSGGAPIPGYTFPSSDFAIDSVTGQVSFLPQTLGKFCFVVQVNEYKNNVFIGFIRRDMMIYVISSTNNTFSSTHNSNISQSQDEYYRIPYNHTFSFDFNVADPDPVLISIGGNGEPLITNNPATFTHTDGNSAAQSNLNWATTDSNFRIHPYLFAFRTLDISGNDSFYLDYSLALKIMDVTYGINDLADNQNISIYPNPNSGSFAIKFSKPITFNSEFIVSDAAGREVYTQTITNPSQSTIDISYLNNGVYFYQLTNNKESFRGKLVIEK